MKGILILAHGSREAATEKTLKEVVSIVETLVENHPIEAAFLQFSQIDLDKGLDNLIMKGVDDIAVIPYFLFEGVHIREDIPGEIEEYLTKHKDIKITMGKTLGADKGLAEIIADRIKEAV